MHVCAYILAVDVAPLLPIPCPPSHGAGRVYTRKLKIPLSRRTQRAFRATRRGTKRFNFRCPRCTDDVTIFIKRDQTDTRKNNENAWEILISPSRFSKPSRMFRAPTTFSRHRTKKNSRRGRRRRGRTLCHRGTTNFTPARIESNESGERGPVLRESADDFERTRGGKGGRSWLRERVEGHEVTYITFPVYGLIRS